MKKYPKYKPSDIDWLGEIPSGWEVRRLATFGRFSKGGGISKSDLVEKGVPVILYGDIYTKYNLRAENIFNFINHDLAADSKLIYKGDLLFTGSGETREDIGKCIVYNGSDEVYAGGDTIIFSQRNNDSLFLAYSFNSNYLINQKAMNSKGDIIVHIYASSLRDIYIPIPSLPEQKSIVHFLDYKTEQIDSFIANRQKQIELLKEQKASIINKAITKGINPDAKMKPSGIKWIGETPEEWDVWKVSRLFKTIGSGTTPKAGTAEYYDDGTIPWVNTGDLNDGILEDCGTRITEKAFADHSTLKIYKKETLLIAMYGATIAKLSVLNFDACTNQACCALANSKLTEVDFAFNWFLSQKQNIINLSYGGGQPNISQDIIRNIRIPLPSKEDQQVILDFIKTETSTIDTLIPKYQKQIDLMQEYRTSLISQAVTGKIDVRGWQPKMRGEAS